MCKSKDEGGQRCFAHARQRVDAATAQWEKAWDAAPLGHDRPKHVAEETAKVYDAHMDLASTSPGYVGALTKAAMERTAPCYGPSTDWQRIAEEGLVRRERNQTLAAAGQGRPAGAGVSHSVQEWRPTEMGTRDPLEGDESTIAIDTMKVNGEEVVVSTVALDNYEADRPTRWEVGVFTDHGQEIKTVWSHQEAQDWHRHVTGYLRRGGPAPAEAGAAA
jgi:hypothetical protein